MKKAIVVSVALLLLVGMVMPAFAQKTNLAKGKMHASEVIKGTVVSVIDTILTIKEDKTQTEKTVTVDAKKLASLKLKAGDEVKVTVNAGGTVAKDIIVIKKAKGLKK